MQEILLKSLKTPTELKGADNAKINQSDILPINMNRIIGGFDETMLSLMGCKETAEPEKQTDAA